jgi:hypothetical protein
MAVGEERHQIASRTVQKVARVTNRDKLRQAP